MSNGKGNEEPLPAAVVSDDAMGLSFVWLVPLVALIIGLSLVWKHYAERGPAIEIYFARAEGVEPKKTKIKYRDVVIGTVTAVQFSEDLSHVVVKADLQQGMEALLSNSARFWVVRPRIGATGATGIDTLFSGPYIALDPGASGGYTEQFTGLEEPPKVLSDAEGRLFRLRAEELGSISIGSPVYHRQIQVGEVTGYHLMAEQGYVAVDVFINAPHDQLVKRNSRFWNVSGVSVALSGEGMSVEMESFLSLLAGGVAFATPESLQESGSVPVGTVFPLYTSREKAEQKSISLRVPYLVYFEDTVRGLSIGAPVEFRGIRIGTVMDIALERDLENDKVRIPVLIGLEPERVPLVETDPAYDRPPDGDLFQEMMDRLVANGLRARLKTGNLLTGQLIIDFDLLANAEPASIDHSGRYPVLPTAPGTISSITQSLTAILEKLEQLPLEEIGQSLSRATAGLDGLINDPDLQASVRSMKRVLQQADQLLSLFNDKGAPMMDEITLLSNKARQMVKQAERTFKALERTTSDQGVMGSELVRTLRELSAAARSVRAVADYLERYPEALVQGKRR